LDQISFELMVGMAVGKVLLGAIFMSPLFRKLAFAAAALIICFVYFREGIPGLLAMATMVRGDFMARPEFSKGILLGLLLGFVAFSWFRRPRT
jgi:hypothetical protein